MLTIYGRMHRAVGRLAPALAMLVLATPGTADAQGARLSPPLEMRVPKPPTLGTGDGAGFLVYELHVTNFSPTAFTLRRIEVLSGDSGGRVLLSLEDSTLARALSRPGVAPPPPPGERARVGGGLRAVAFLWVPVDARTPPARVRHRLTVVPATSDSATAQTLEGVATPVTNDVATIGPPLRGGNWLAANGPDPNTGHRRALIPVEGTPAIAQRFAIDYVKIGDNGQTFSGERLKNESYYAQGVDAIAVADGIVAATKDSIPENIPGPASRAVPITLETVGGNYVILDIGNGRYAFYAHLQPGSLRVKKGDRVKRGQVVGLVGNSGNSTEPHLHFHISDSPSPLGSEGIPYRHDSFQLVGRCRQALSGCSSATPETRRGEIPMGNMLIRFPE